MVVWFSWIVVLPFYAILLMLEQEKNSPKYELVNHLNLMKYVDIPNTNQTIVQ